MKRTLSSIAAAALVLGTLAPAAFADTTTSQYTDVTAGSYGASAINALTADGFIHGYSNGTFQPNYIVSRGQLLAYFMNTVESVTGVKPVANAQYYADVAPGNWAFNYVGAAQENSWLNQYWLNIRPGYNFNENYQASLGDAASFFVAAMESAGKLTSADLNGMSPLAYAKSIGLFNGLNMTDNVLMKSPTVTEPAAWQNVYMDRASAAIFLQNVLAWTQGQLLPPSDSVGVKAASNDVAANSSVTLNVYATDASGNPVTLPSTAVVSYSVDNQNGTIVQSAGSQSAQLVVQAPGTYNVTATVDGMQSAPMKITVYGAPSTIQLSQPAQMVAGAGSSETVTATVYDANGNVVPNATVNFMSSNNAVASVTATATTNAQGVATATVDGGADQGTATITATSGAATQTATVMTGAPAGDTVTVSAANADLGVNSTTTLSAVLKDAKGNVINYGTTPVTYAIYGNAPGATIINGNQLVVTQPGTVNVTATVYGVTSAPTPVTVYGQATGVTLSAASSSLVANGASTDTITAKVVDANGNVVGNFNGTADIATSGSGVSLPSPATVTFTNGVGTFTVTSNGTVAGETATISANTLQTTNGSNMTNDISYSSTSVSTVAAKPTQLSLTSNIPSVSVNNATSNNVVQLTAQVQDSTGTNFSESAYVTLTLTGPGSFSPTSSVTSVTEYTNAYGEVQVPVYATQGMPGQIVVNATATGLSAGSVTVPTYITTAPASVSVTATPSKTSSGTAFTLYKAELLDANGHLITSGTNASDPISITDNTATVGGTLQYYTVDTSTMMPSTQGMPTTFTNGVAYFAVENTSVGTSNPTISVEDTTESLTGTAPYADVVGSAAKVAISSATNAQTVKAGQSVTISAQVEDANGNQVQSAGQNVVFYFVPSDNTLQATLPNGVSAQGSANDYVAQTNAQGIASVTVTVPSAAATGSFQLDANLQGGSLSAAESPSYTEVAPANFGTALSVGTYNSTSGTVTPYTWTTSLAAGSTESPTGLVLTNAVGTEANANDQIQITTSNPNVLALSSYDAGSSTTKTVTLSGGSYSSLPTIQGMQVGSATITFTDITNPSVPVVSETISVGAGHVASGAILVNGLPLSTSNELNVTANQPTAVTIYNVDAGDNPVLVTNGETNGQSSETFALTDVNNGGQFRATPNGAPISFASIPVGSSSTTVYYVNPSTVSISGDLNVTAPLTATALGVSVTASTAGSAGSAVLTLSNSSGTVDFNGTLPVTVTGAATSPNGTAATLPTTATFVNGQATVPVTLTSATAQTLAFAVEGLSDSVSVTPSAAALSSATLKYSNATANTTTPSSAGTLTGTDAYGNSVTPSGGTYTVVNSAGTTDSNVTVSSTGVVTVSSSATTNDSGTYTVTYTQGSGSSAVTATATVAVTG